MRLSLAHQAELVSLMFEQGYLLMDWSPEEKSLLPVGLAIEKNLHDLIKKERQKCEKDSYYVSQRSEVETIYQDFYLKPIYHNLRLAYQKKEEIKNVINTPYTYYIESSQEPIIQADIAKWMAYHLCQQANTPLSKHESIYRRTQGAARLAYYETLEEVLKREKAVNYTFCLKLKGSKIEAKNIYFELGEKSLKYTLLNYFDSKTVLEGEIASSQLAVKFSSPLDLEQLNTVKSGILKLIATQGHLPLQKKYIVTSFRQYSCSKWRAFVLEKRVS